MFISRLRGNTFVTLLLRSAVRELSEKPEIGETNNGITRSNMFADLLRLADPSYTPSRPETLSSYFSRYLKGELASSPKYFNFESPILQDGLQTRIKEEYSTVLREMDLFCKEYLEKSHLRLLVGGLVEAILIDDSFHGTFDIGGRWVEKEELRGIKEFALQPFLVSVWNTILSKYPDTTEGAETYRRWSKDAGYNTARTITTDIGRETAKIITVNVELLESVEAPLVNSEQNLGEKKGPAEKTAEPETVEAEVIDDNPRLEKKNVAKKGNTYYQYAKTIFNIENIENFNG